MTRPGKLGQKRLEISACGVDRSGNPWARNSRQSWVLL